MLHSCPLQLINPLSILTYTLESSEASHSELTDSKPKCEGTGEARKNKEEA